MIEHHYSRQLELLKEHAGEFALANPALAPFLGGDRTDPDVERLLEAVAFQNALLHRKLECDFPLAVTTLTQLILPHYLRPVPASTVIGFTSDATVTEPVTIPAGTQLTSPPVDGTVCLFRTSTELKLEPLELLDASFARKSGRAGELRLSLGLRGKPLSAWRPGPLRLFLSGELSWATDWYLLLSRHLGGVLVWYVGGRL